MNTQEYINDLKNQLRKLPDEDREDAIAYYFEYLAEAGPDGAAEAMKKLGSPAELAAGIRADQAMQDFEDLSEQPGVGPKGAAVGQGVRAVWLAGLAAVPRNVLAIFVTAIVIVVFFAVMIALFASSVALIGGGVLAAIAGFWVGFTDWTVWLFYGGAGLTAAACGFLLFIFSVWCSKHLLLGIAKIFNGIRRKRGQMNSARYDQYYEQPQYGGQTQYSRAHYSQAQDSGQAQYSQPQDSQTQDGGQQQYGEQTQYGQPQSGQTQYGEQLLYSDQTANHVQSQNADQEKSHIQEQRPEPEQEPEQGQTAEPDKGSDKELNAEQEQNLEQEQSPDQEQNPDSENSPEPEQSPAGSGTTNKKHKERKTK
jgi:uncharacterized membrane protein